jgi:predicted metalloprotease with PDZ domain
MLMLHPSAGGGLEHLNSTALIMRRFAFRPEAAWDDFLSLVAHEYFHLWNVKRIRPDALGPFDYTGENYTRLLWLAEGGTSYYEDMLLRRAGIGTDRDVLASFAATMQKIDNTPGRLEMSLEEASFDAWIKYYRPDENAVNSQVSYYDKGALVAMLLDLEIRRRSDGARSLDDVVRALDAEFYQKNRNYTPEDLQQLAARFAGSSLDAFFSSYVRGRAELDYDAAFAPFGLRLDRGANSPAAAGAFLTDDLRQDADRLIVPRVVEGTPAYEQGLSAGDQIIALDGMRVTRETLLARLAEKKPGDVIRLTVFRFDELRTLEIRLGKKATGTYRLLPVEKPTPAQQRLYQSWMSQTVTD